MAHVCLAALLIVIAGFTGWANPGKFDSTGIHHEPGSDGYHIHDINYLGQNSDERVKKEISSQEKISRRSSKKRSSKKAPTSTQAKKDKAAAKAKKDKAAAKAKKDKAAKKAKKDGASKKGDKSKSAKSSEDETADSDSPAKKKYRRTGNGQPVAVGDSQRDVLAKLGDPEYVVGTEGKTTIAYENGRVKLANDAVVSFDETLNSGN